MDIRKLQYFLAVAKEGQITRAAKKLHMAQPPLSQQLKLLEAELGIQLLERSENHKLKLTAAGHMLRNRAEQILNMVDQTVTELKDMTGGFQGTLSVGITTTWDTIFLPDRIRDFRDNNPEINIQLLGGDSAEMLSNGEVEIGVTMVPVDSEKYESISLPDEPIAAAFGAFADCNIPVNYIRLAELADKPLIIHRKFEESFLQSPIAPADSPRP